MDRASWVSGHGMGVLAAPGWGLFPLEGFLREGRGKGKRDTAALLHALTKKGLSLICFSSPLLKLGVL